MKPSLRQPPTALVSEKPFVTATAELPMAGALHAALSGLAAIVYFMIALWVLRTGHLHEDAYILFTYVENLARGEGIVYYAGGPPAEGATDFLWLMILGALRWASVDAGLAAAALNAVGIGIICWLSLRALPQGLELASRVLVGLCIAFVLVLSPISSAAVAGFSTAFFAAIAVISYCVYRDNAPRTMHWLPWCALLLGLLRPDGVVIGTAYALLGLASQWRSAHCKRYVLHSLAAASIGVAYFLWRFEYFGQLLPLPLYVKSRGDEVFPGISENLKWLLANFALVIVASAGVWRREAERTRAILAIAPLLALLLSLSFAHQTQNVAFRFQAPVTAVLVLISGVTIGRWIQKDRRWTRIFMMLSGSVLVGTLYGFALFGKVQTLRNAEYINFLPYRLAHEVDETTSIALTEAGRMAYWVGGKKYDLIGLNTAYPAVNGLDVDYLKRIEPDILFVHTVHSLSEWPQREAGFFEVSLADIRRRLVVDPNWKALRDPIDRAPLVVYDFLDQSGDAYELVMVRYFTCYCHLYAIKKGGSVAYDKFLAALEASFQPQARLSYWEMTEKRKAEKGALERVKGIEPSS